MTRLTEREAAPDLRTLLTASTTATDDFIRLGQAAQEAIAALAGAEASFLSARMPQAAATMRAALHSLSAAWEANLRALGEAERSRQLLGSLAVTPEVA